MKVANLAFLSAIILVANLPSTEAKKKKKKVSGKNKGLRSPAAASTKSNKKPDGDVSDLFKSNRKKPGSRNTNNRKPSNKKSPNKKPSQSNKKPVQKRPSGSSPSNRAVDDDISFDDDFETPIPTYIPTVSDTFSVDISPLISLYVKTYLDPVISYRGIILVHSNG